MFLIAFQLFDVAHLSWLFISLLLILIMCSHYRRLSAASRRKMRIWIAWTFIVAEIVKNIYIWHYEQWHLNVLPLELCALAMFAIFLHAYTQSTIIGQLLFAVFLPGAVCALLFPAWTHRALLDFVSVHSFLYHILIVGYVCMMLYVKEIVPNIRAIWQPALFIACVTPIIYGINERFGTNFFFLSKPAKGSPIVILEHWLGNPGYIFGLVCLLIIVWVILYGSYYLIRMKKPRT